MQIETKKSLGWIALLFGLGGTLVFWFTYLVGHFYPPAFGVWVVCHVALLAAPIYLWRLYCIEPMPPLGLWQLTMRDLFATSLVVGGLLRFYQSFRRELFLPNGVILAVSAGVLFVAGLLVASRKGHRDRYLYAAAYAASAAGLIGGSAYLLILLVMMAQGGMTLTDHLYYMFVHDISVSLWPEYLLRYSLYHLPVGFALIWIFRLRKWSRIQEPQVKAVPASISSDAGI